MFSTNRRYNIQVIALMAVYTVLCFLVPETLKAMAAGGMTGGPLAVIIGAAPSYPLAAVVVLYVKHLLELDELQQRIELLSLSMATGVILVGGTAYGFVSLHLGVTPFPLFLILPIYLVIWCVALYFVRRRYV